MPPEASLSKNLRINEMRRVGLKSLFGKSIPVS
jgi:hypothetical protein